MAADEHATHDASTGGRGGPARRSPSMADVAARAGVSHQTVSRVLRDHPNVRVTTRERVLAAIDELGYRPNHAARVLVTGRSGALGVISLNSTLYGPASMLYAVEEASRSAGYSVTVATVRAVDLASLREGVQRLLDRAVDGIVVIAPLASASEAIEDLPVGVPVVAVEGDPSTPPSVVRVDQVSGARVATEHLLAAGHRTVWHVAGPTEWFDAQGRITGWRTALADAGVEAPEPLSGDWSAASGYAAGRELARTPQVTAVFAANDQMALGVYRALRERGLRVPDDISVVGFDDIPEAAYLTPALTTMRQDFAAVGTRALRALLHQIETGRTEWHDEVVHTQLIIRESTAPPPAPYRRRS